MSDFDPARDVPRTTRERRVRRGSERLPSLVIVDPETNRVVVDRQDLAGNDLTAVIRWCDRHAYPVSQFRDGSHVCPIEAMVGFDPGDCSIVDGPWERPA